MYKKSTHDFHIPVMGLAYTIDSPVRVAHLGISSVISIMDDDLMERMNGFYSERFDLPYQEITQKIEDFRAKRITAYLNTVDRIVKRKFNQFKQDLLDSKKNVESFLQQLPTSSSLRSDLQRYLQSDNLGENFKKFIDQHLNPGAIDVNIMTKVDKENYLKGQALPLMYNDAHAALRGFAQSELRSSVVLSAGMNPKLYTYFESFEDFYPNEAGELNKKITIKVSDYRSAQIQGQFFAKKGLWVSEYRIESGLNCGGHAFATEGYLMGAILKEFQEKKELLITTTHQVLCEALAQKQRQVPTQAMELQITAQGGVGTAEEHAFLLQHYQLDSVGWGSPFLLVPEATSVDAETRLLLQKAKEDDLYLSELSPLGVPFNTLKGSSNDRIRAQRLSENRTGSSCPKKYLALNKTFSDKGWCTASRKFQEAQLELLAGQKDAISEEEFSQRKQQITDKACLCIGLANAALMDHGLPLRGEAQGIAICPGPNMAYFTKEVSLSDMTGHIYGTHCIMDHADRPHFFIKELRMYRDHFFKEHQAYLQQPQPVKLKKLQKFKANLIDGIQYYRSLFGKELAYFQAEISQITEEIDRVEKQVSSLEL